MKQKKISLTNSTKSKIIKEKELAKKALIYLKLKYYYDEKFNNTLSELLGEKAKDEK